MPSRIDIGPEGGPFVAINENSNNLELQDINGNVIAKWDETAGQWDLNNNSLTGINAIDAGSANVESLSTGSASINGPLDAETATVDDLDIGGRDASETGWIHDGSHDFGSDGDTYNLSGEYDLIKIEVANPVNDASLARLTVNGDDGNNYDYWSLDGTRESGDDKILLTPDNRDGSVGVIYMSGRWADPDDAGTFSFFVGLGVDDANVARSGKNSNVETPLESITANSGTNINIDVYGKNPGQ